jgi:hypothetical protein
MHARKLACPQQRQVDSGKGAGGRKFLSELGRNKVCRTVANQASYPADLAGVKPRGGRHQFCMLYTLVLSLQRVIRVYKKRKSDIFEFQTKFCQILM